MKSLYRSVLVDLPKKKALLKKIKVMHLVFEIGVTRVDARLCTGVAIDEEAANANVKFTRPGGESPENYDLADITTIKRLRSRRWLIKIKGNANPA